MNVVARKSTPMSVAEVAPLFVRVWRETVGAEPFRELAGLVLALAWIETAAGKSIQNFNFGNISASSRWDGDAWRPSWFEVNDASSERDKALHEAMVKGQAPQAFRAYPTADAGMRDFVRVLRGTFPEVLNAAEGGDAEKFRQAISLKYSKDYARNPAAVTSNLSKLRDSFGKALDALALPSKASGVGTLIAAAPTLLAIGIAAATLYWVKAKGTK